MDDHDFGVDDMSDWHPSENFAKVLKHEGISAAGRSARSTATSDSVFSGNFPLESVLGVDCRRLMVAPVQKDPLGIQQLVEEEEQNTLDRFGALVHNVTVKQVQILF